VGREEVENAHLKRQSGAVGLGKEDTLRVGDICQPCRKKDAKKMGKGGERRTAREPDFPALPYLTISAQPMTVGMIAPMICGEREGQHD
jgi:hypothetical protein